MATALATSGVSVLDLAAHQGEMAERLAGILSADLEHLGLTLPRFVIENVSLPPEVEAAMDKRTSMGVLGDLNQFTRFQAATAITEAASNPGGLAGAGVGIGVGATLGAQARAGAVALRGAHRRADRPAAAAGHDAVVPRGLRSAGRSARARGGRGPGGCRHGHPRDAGLAGRHVRLGAARLGARAWPPRPGRCRPRCRRSEHRRGAVAVGVPLVRRRARVRPRGRCAEPAPTAARGWASRRPSATSGTSGRRTHSTGRCPSPSLPPFDVRCERCGAQQTTTAIAGRCGSCQAALVVVDDLDGRLKAPDAVVPFVVDRAQAGTAFAAWTSSRWFAPSALKKVTPESMQGTYLPHWGFDDRTVTDYTGERGDYYYTTETYTTQENGRTVTRTRQVRHTRWSHASGRVARDFVDVLAAGVRTPDAGTLAELGPWSTAAADGYAPQFLAGFDAPRYEVDPTDGLADAQRQMAEVIADDCRADIGGDEQRLDQVRTVDQDVRFRLLLMPLWLATYVASGRTYDVFVNANTGEVIGERPYSAVKIAAAVVAALAVVAAALLLYRYR
ncbi:hypothetical protein GCM10025868_18520 [Angustibacter aerolatus]|uniref:SPFH domain-containing protein n=1 Tax=Angustibacter aerolatus TaxID=1162965 RepID=A0ABQ6JFN1_9ACTN|nr:hypothetical protein GCM10025868_18520 [Angustibacter aerolatus]